MAKKKIRIDPFEAQCFVFWNCSPLQVKRYVEKHLPGLPQHMRDWLQEADGAPPQGVCMSDIGKSAHTLIWLRHDPKKRPDILAHEAAHAAFRVMTHYGISVDENGQELLSTLTGYIVRQVLDV